MLRPSKDPTAIAHIFGGEGSSISGMVSFSPHPSGTLVTAQIHGLPQDEAPCSAPIFAFHIHDGEECTAPDFQDAGGHLDPEGCPHPHHAGDLPPLFGCGGEAYLSVLTDRFSIPDVIGHTVVIHKNPDDFATQPSGNAGERLACGVIRAL